MGNEAPPADWFVLFDRIDDEVRQLQRHRSVWGEFKASHRQNDDGGSSDSGLSNDGDGFGDGGWSGTAQWVEELYFRTQALGIRRMIDGDRRAGSFKRLLHKMTEDAPLLTRAWFLSAGGRIAEEDNIFPERPGLGRFSHLDPAVPRADLRTLEGACTGIKRYVDQFVTHAQLSPDAAVPAGDEIETALATLVQLRNRYFRLLKPGQGATKL